MIERRRQILMIEDNAADVRLTREAFADQQIAGSLHVVRDGVEALEFLRRLPPFGAAPAPDLILLDLNLPRKSGRELLVELKSDPSLMLIPVVVLSTSGALRDVQECYRLHANAYVQKPVDFDRFVQAVRSIENFWLSTATAALQ